MVLHSRVYDPAQEAAASTVLIVDDEVLIRLMIADELRAHGISVIEAANSSEALSVLRSVVPIDLLLTDVQMPGPVDGIRLAALAREERPELKVIVASGKSVTIVPKTADAFFRKPYDPDVLVRCVDTLLADLPK